MQSAVAVIIPLIVQVCKLVCGSSRAGVGSFEGLKTSAATAAGLYFWWHAQPDVQCVLPCVQSFGVKCVYAVLHLSLSHWAGYAAAADGVQSSMQCCDRTMLLAGI